MKCPLCQESIPDRAKRCSHCHGDIATPPGWKRRILKALTKPLLIVFTLLATALVSSWLAPAVIAQLDRDRSVRESRRRIAQEIIAQGTLVETQLNNLETMLAIFHKDTARLSSDEFRDAQAAMRTKMADRYLDFERVGWWWLRKVQRDAQFPEPLLAEKKNDLTKFVDEYHSALGATTEALNVLWDQLLRQPRPAPGARTDPYKIIVKEQAKVLEAAGQRRRDALWGLAYLFEEPEPSWWIFW